MKATELKIGDLVLYKGKPAKIIDFIGDILRCEAGGLKFIENYSASNVKPIPLTKEILEKNGWHRDHSNILINNHYDQYSIGQHNGDWDFLCNEYVLCEIQYVHQLQHILWAFGIDDNLKI